MSWGEWMVVNMTIEEQLALEKQARAALIHHDADAVGRLCSALIKQNAMQAQLIKQATGRIAELEMKEFLTQQQDAAPSSDATSAAPLMRVAGFVRGILPWIGR